MINFPQNFADFGKRLPQRSLVSSFILVLKREIAQHLYDSNFDMQRVLQAEADNFAYSNVIEDEKALMFLPIYGSIVVTVQIMMDAENQNEQLLKENHHPVGTNLILHLNDVSIAEDTKHARKKTQHLGNGSEEDPAKQGCSKVSYLGREAFSCLRAI